MNVPTNHMDSAPPPGVVNWFKVYCVAMAVLYLVCAVAGVLFMVFASEITKHDAEFSRPEALIAGGIFLALGLVLFALFAAALFLPCRPWVWIYHLVLICLGLTSACTMAATIPLLIFWIKPETRAWYGRMG